MHPCWQILERHRDELDTKTVLWLDPPHAHALIKTHDHCITPDRTLHRANPDQFSAPDSIWPQQIEQLVLFHPKAKGRLEWWLHQFQQQNIPAQLWLVGENLGGIKSLPKRLAPWAHCDKLDSARHCGLFDVHLEKLLPADQDWMHFDWNDQRIYALPGVFSQNRLDTGTAVLLEHLPALTGELLELGSGSGVISLALLNGAANNRLTTVDIDWLAIASTKRTLAEAGLSEGADIIWSDGLSEVPPRRFDHLVTNPPFHTGLRTHYEPSERFFAASHDWLKAGGSLWWVANDFLDYQSALKKGAFEVQEVAHQRGFRVYRAVRKG